MRRLIASVTLALVSSLVPAAQSPGPSAPLPVRRVVLYKAGVGYFEHLGDVRGNQNLSIRFTSAQLDDVLKSLTAIDLGKGQISGISYNSVAPLDRRLGALRLPLQGSTTAVEVLDALRGSRVDVTAPSGAISGRLVSVERRTSERQGHVVTTAHFAVLTDAGEFREFELSPAVHVRLADRDLRQDLSRYLDVLGSAREQDVRTMVISATGAGERRLFVSYVSEVPIWKSTYRLVVPTNGKPFMQGWAIVDNTVGEDWTDVELSLVAGAPQAFIQQLSQPYYGKRPVIPLPPAVSLSPQTHGGPIQSGRGTVGGVVRDTGGGALPGARIRLLGPSGEVATAHTDVNGSYRLSAPPGTYRLEAQLAGFTTSVADGVDVVAGSHAEEDILLNVGSLSETVTVSSSAVGVPGSVSPPPPPPAAAPMRQTAEEAYDQMEQVSAAASGRDLGEMFEYRIKEPVTLRKDQSALVPILNAEVQIEKVSLWNRAPGSGRPLRAMWITNSTGLTLDGGSVSIVDGNAFAGEGLVDSTKPGEKRLVSYAADLAVLVDAQLESAPRRTTRVRARDGILIQETDERASWIYKARNEGSAASTLIVEHPIRPGWKLADGQATIESTPAAHRFRLVVPPTQEASLTVREVRPGMSRISIADVSDALIAQLSATGVDSQALQRALRPVMEKKAELAELDRRVQELTARRVRIVEEQARLRENMKALRGSSEERQLLQRYTRQLDEQENTLASLQRDIDAASVARNAAVAELSKLIGSLTFEIG